MEVTFKSEEGRENTSTHAVVSAKTLRDAWASRLRVELFNDIVAQGGNPSTFSFKKKEYIDTSLKAASKTKFPLDVDYLVRIVEDDLITPVEILGGEATPILVTIPGPTNNE